MSEYIITLKDGDTATVGVATSPETYTIDVGTRGMQGPIGYTGSFGDTGYTGSQGIQGYTGSQGDIGVTGYTGSQGDIGDTGYTGSQGIQGYTGSFGTTGYTGSQGIQGYTGSQGILGYTGSFGTTGYTGSQGIQGYTGSFGDTGYTGSQGIQGYAGSQGNVGPQGPQGEFGGAAFDYLYSNNEVSSDPGNGYFKFNNADLSQANILYINWLDHYGANSFNYIQTIDDSTSAIKGTLKLNEEANVNHFAYFSIVGEHVDHVGYSSIPVSWIYGNGPNTFVNGADSIITLTRTGDKGDTGYTGSQGILGYTGSFGTTGYTGSFGTTGYTGSFGTTGYTGSRAAGDTIFIQNTQPSYTGPYLWVETGLGSGTDFTFWIEDGQ